MLVDSEPRLDGHGHVDRSAHRGDAGGDSRRVEHQGRAEARGLHTIARATDVQVDLVVAGGRTELRRRGELLGIGAAELERDRMLRGIEAQQPLARRRAAARAR